ncbi:glycosyltransferase family 4 protein [Marinilabiliaceae bacterium ANBcel2]|nr:glycosyltransferase family 4 protein [Marinilabiliaceae bacterium ANBcel2]
MRKTLFVGPFPPPYMGDGIKNINLKAGFEKAGINNIIWFDTVKRDRFILNHVWCLLSFMFVARQVIFSLNKHGRYAIIPLFWMLKLFNPKKRGALYVVGGTFDLQLKRENYLYRSFFVRMVNSLDQVFVESQVLKAGLEECGVKRVKIVYNPRLNMGYRWNFQACEPHRIVFISRITEVKGVLDLINVVEGLNKSGFSVIADFYGPIDEAFKDVFFERLRLCGRCCFYKGVVDPDQVQQLLCNYRLLALPTFHFGEGLPGVLVEAGMCGIPIIITRFNSLPEFFSHKENAFFIDVHDVEALRGAIVELISNDIIVKALSAGIKERVKPFESKEVVFESLKYLSESGWIF